MLYVAIEKLEHGLTSHAGSLCALEELAEQEQWEAAEKWLKRGYTILEDIQHKALVILDETRAIGVIGIVRLPIPF